MISSLQLMKIECPILQFNIDQQYHLMRLSVK